jgi:hypothetical protein
VLKLTADVNPVAYCVDPLNVTNLLLAAPVVLTVGVAVNAALLEA